MKIPPNIERSFERLLIDRIQKLSSPLALKLPAIAERLSPLADIRVVLFDVYGTLVISGAGDISIASEISNEYACAEALRAAGFSGNLEEAGTQGSAGLIQAIRATHAARHQEGIEYPEVEILQEWDTVLRTLQQANLVEGTISPETGE